MTDAGSTRETGPRPVQVGYTVHFVIDGGPNSGQHRPGVVVGVGAKDPTVLALRVFTHPQVDKDEYDRGDVFIAAAKHDDDEVPAPGTWHARDDTHAVPKEHGEHYPNRPQPKDYPRA